jgi:hypothetical protein
VLSLIKGTLKRKNSKKTQYKNPLKKYKPELEPIYECNCYDYNDYYTICGNCEKMSEPELKKLNFLKIVNDLVLRF